jgi:hypothetical protein
MLVMRASLGRSTTPGGVRGVGAGATAGGSTVRPGGVRAVGAGVPDTAGRKQHIRAGRHRRIQARPGPASAHGPDAAPTHSRSRRRNPASPATASTPATPCQPGQRRHRDRRPGQFRHVAERGDVQHTLGQPDRRAGQGDERDQAERSPRPGHRGPGHQAEQGQRQAAHHPGSRNLRQPPRRPAAAAGWPGRPRSARRPAPWPGHPPGAAPRCRRRRADGWPPGGPAPPGWPAPARPAAQSPHHAAGGRPLPRRRPRRSPASR